MRRYQPGGGTIYLPPGTYLDDSASITLNISTAVPLRFQLAPGATIKKGVNAANGVIFSISECAELTIEGGELNGNADSGVNQNSDIIRTAGTDPKEKLTIRDTHVHNGGSAIVLRNESLERVTLDNVDCEEQFSTVHPLVTIGGSADDITIRGCHFEDTKNVFHTFGAGFGAQNVTISDTDIIADNGQKCVHLEGATSSQWIWDGCYIEQRGSGDAFFTVIDDAKEMTFSNCTFKGGRVRFKDPANHRFDTCTFIDVLMQLDGSAQNRIADCDFRGIGTHIAIEGDGEADKIRGCLFEGSEGDDISLNGFDTGIIDTEIVGNDFTGGVNCVRVRKTIDGLRFEGNRILDDGYSNSIYTASNAGVSTPSVFKDNILTVGTNTIAYTEGTVTVPSGSTASVGGIANAPFQLSWRNSTSNTRIEVEREPGGVLFRETTGNGNADVEYKLELDDR